MRSFRKKIYAAAGYNTVFFGSGRPEFKPTGPMPSAEDYLKEVAEGVCAQIPILDFSEGVIGSFMPQQFIKQGNLPGFLPFMLPTLLGKPCIGVEGACGTGGRAIGVAIRSILSDLADSVFVTAFEIQNVVKAVYGADILAGADYYAKERKSGHAYFFPGVFADRTGVYYDKYGYESTRKGMAKWYEQAILNARLNPKAQEYYNKSNNLFELGMTAPDPEKFIPYLNAYDCSKVSDGASAIGIFSAEGLRKSGIVLQDAVEIIGIGEAEGDITLAPEDPTTLATTRTAYESVCRDTGMHLSDIGILELHDCFSITGLLALETIGAAKKGESAGFVLEGNTSPSGTLPTNLSGGLCGFGHPTGASGVRQLVDLQQQLTGKAENPAKMKHPVGMMISMGGNDKTVTCLLCRAIS